MIVSSSCSDNCVEHITDDDLEVGRQSSEVRCLKSAPSRSLRPHITQISPKSACLTAYLSDRALAETIVNDNMSTGLPPMPLSPGVGARRKGPKTLPKLPLSVFTPPPTGSSDNFPRPPSPSTIHPEKVIDAHVVSPGGDLSKWQQETGQVLSGKLAGAVVSLAGTEPSEIEKAITS